jgi:hypothetical protein
MTAGHNGGPIDRRITDKEFRSLVTLIVFSRLPGNQKLLAIGAVSAADGNGEAALGAKDMKLICSVSKGDTVFAAKKAIAENGLGIVETVAAAGKANRYRIMPPEVVQSIITAYNARRDSEDIPVPQNGTPPIHKNGMTPIPKKETSTHPEKVTTPIPQNGTSTHPENGDGSRARIETPSGLLFLDNTNTPLPPKGPTKADALEAFNAYNETALRCSLPQAVKFTPDRERRIVARLKDYGLDGWKRALANIEKSAFLTGGTHHGFRADLTFICQAESFGKLHDGGYGNGRHATTQKSASDEMRSIEAIVGKEKFAEIMRGRQ